MTQQKERTMTAGRLLAWVIGIIYFKFLYFDLLWALDSTFSGFQFVTGYLTKLAFATLLATPLLLWRSKWYVLTICLLLDGWLIANLMYFRTYFTVIPAASYGLIGNLADFTDSVWESLRWGDVVFVLSTVAVMAVLWNVDIRAVIKASLGRMLRTLALLFGVPVATVGVNLLCEGGYKEAYSDLMYDYSTCGAAVYTIPGAMSYELIKGKVELTPEVQKTIEDWLAARPQTAKADIDSTRIPDNCIVLLLESFESWPIGKTIEGQEITPNLNRLLADSTTFYAPNVQSQVKGARSIDAQLILHTGLLPVNYGAYSYRFAHNVYPSIDKAWKYVHGNDARSMSFTVDKRTVWNVAVVAQDFGYELYDKPHFVLDVKTGPRGRLGDDSFLRQVFGKINDDNMFAHDGNTFVQCVTYSGHTPFVIPDKLKKVHFTDKIPERLRHYLEVANYTDRAIGAFVDSLVGNPKFARTAIVITGDHEGIGVQRAEFMRNPEIAKWLSADQYVPFIVLNSPVGGRYDGVMGQVDMYPTLLQLLGLDKYPWKGLGHSILDPAKKAFAVDNLGKVSGDTQGLDGNSLRHARSIYDVSDLIISSNYFNSNDISITP